MSPRGPLCTHIIVHGCSSRIKFPRTLSIIFFSFLSFFFSFLPYLVPPTEVNQEHQYKRYDNFPVPKLENVYKAWKPVDHGHPLKDETLFYAPPSMERVRFQHEAAAANGPQSRSIDDEVFHPPQPRRDQAIVIPAEPKKEPPKQGYSVYGSPDINYSALYTSQPPRNSGGGANGPSGLLPYQVKQAQLNFIL